MYRDTSRRAFLRRSALVGTGALLSRNLLAAETQPAEMAEEISPAEDLMREHGLLRRILLIYRECIRRLDGDGAGEMKLEIVSDSAKITRSFIENYHEKLEEEHLFPRFRESKTLVEVVDVLVQQHQAGRRLTDAVLRCVDGKSALERDDKRRLKEVISQFMRMYEPHAAREDTELFPAMHQVFKENEYRRLGDEFEKKEKTLFGEGGFEQTVKLVAGIEKTLGIYELAQFTPQA